LREILQCGQDRELVEAKGQKIMMIIVIIEYFELSYLASARKSILSMIYGPFVESSKINLSKTLAQLQFDDKGGLLPIEKQATILDLITARSGVYHPASNPGDQVNSRIFKSN
jgi:hypothetical protein